MSTDAHAHPHTSATTATKRPTAAQVRILMSLASRPSAKVINGPYGVFITDGHGWSPSDIHITTAQLVGLIRDGFVLYRTAPMGRAEYVVTAAGRDAVKAR